MELLSDAAVELYSRLVKADRMPLGDGPGRIWSRDPALAELCQHGLAWVASDDWVQPVSPNLALGKLLIRRQRDLMERHRELLEEYEGLARLAQATAGREHPSSPYLEMISAGEVASVQRELQAGVVWDCRSVQIPWLVPPAPVGMGRARYRLICTAEFLADFGHRLEPAADCRILPDLPMRLLLADGVGLLLLTASGSGAAAIVRAPVVVAAIGQYFDLLWERATPVSGGTSPAPGVEPLPRSERVILGMLMAGLTDAAIARSLGISARSVRRHVAAMAERAGVSSRFALGAAAVRLGWVAE